MRGKYQNTFPRLLFESLAEAYVCRECPHYDDRSVCHCKDPYGCAVFRLLPLLVKLEREWRQRQIDSYGSILEREVCPKCPHRDESGHCCLRERMECGLLINFPIVLKVIKEANFLSEQSIRQPQKRKQGTVSYETDESSAGLS